MNQAIYSQRLFYKKLAESDVTESYSQWLNDSEVNRYIEARHTHHTVESCREFVRKVNLDPAHHLFGIFLQSDGSHIGNIKLGFIDKHHDTGQLGILIGQKMCWGKGFATESIKSITLWGFEFLHLEKIEAGCYEENTASLRAFLKVGYQVEGFLRSHSNFAKKRSASFLLGILPHEIRKLPE
jgi:ribosomal-protein-alanine N-acetyltransferase